MKNKAVEGFSGDKISDEKDNKFEETKAGEKIISKSEEDVKKEDRGKDIREDSHSQYVYKERFSQESNPFGNQAKNEEEEEEEEDE